MALSRTQSAVLTALACLASGSTVAAQREGDARGTQIMVPVAWEEQGSFISRLGFYEDEEKYVWAVESKLFATLPECDMFLAGFYINADNDRTTGRVYGDPSIGFDGVDIQFTCSLKPRRDNFTHWRGDRGVRLPAYPDDYRSELVGNVYYLTIRKAIFGDLRLAPAHSVRFTLATSLQPHQAVIIGVDRAVKATGYFSYDFVGFHAQKGARRKKARAGIVYQRGKMCIWDTGLDRFGPDEPIPDPRVKLETLRLSAARGESESVQLCVTTPEPLEDLAVAVGDLVGPDGAHLSGSHVEVQYVGFATNGFNECVQDIVRPEFRRANAKNSFVLLTAAVPRDAGAGLYRGHVTLRVNGTTDIEVPVALRVYGFELSRVASFKSSFCVSPNYIAPYYNRPDRPRMTRQEILDIYDKILLLTEKYKVAPGYDPVHFWGILDPVIEDGRLRIDWMKFDRQAEIFFSKYPVFRWTYFQAGSKGHIGAGWKRMKFLFPDGDPDLSSPHLRKYWPEFVKQTCDHLKEKGWFDKIVNTIFDEPWESSYANINLLSRLAKQAVPDLKVGVFHLVYESKLAGAIDTWIVQPPGVGSLLKKGCKEFWIYNDPRLGSFICPASDIRSLFWMAFRHGMGGFLVWNTVSWTGIVDDRILSPHYIMYHPADTRTGNPYASLRMTLVRDGVEDYEYLKLFERRLAQARAKGHPGLAEAEAVWAAVRRGMPTVNAESETEFPLDSIADLSALRDRMAEQIEKLSD